MILLIIILSIFSIHFPFQIVLAFTFLVGVSDDIRCSLNESTPTMIVATTDNTDTVIVSITEVDIDRDTTIYRSSTLSTIRRKVTNQALTQTQESNKKGYISFYYRI